MSNSPVRQVKYAENQVRPVVLAAPPGGSGFQTILLLTIATTAPLADLDVEASLGALALGPAGAEVDTGIRVLVDGASLGLGASQSFTATANEELVSFPFTGRKTVGPLTHTVELQWYVANDAGETAIGFVNEDLDGCALRVTEVAR